ncbi:class I adenylate-forming enzyme family protein [Desulfotruncus alcoholivorax]|uniref:class I adenylate-forming enzyme family protein n=1 Tax=Desulfotruncus alcoholivorax TaxID=265477 RepID=UPI0003F754AC|nr:long-chain-fatty-acid--CoA ligase [Desulfotruncus alcoholivorax]
MSKVPLEFGQPKTRYSNNLVDSMKMNLAKNPNMKAIICEDRMETWAEMWERTNRLGNGLYNLGLEKGDRVAMLLNNCFEFPETFVTTTKSGFIMTPLNRHLKAGELLYQLNDCGATAVVINPEYLELIKSIQSEACNLKHVIVTGDNKFEDTISYEQLITQSSPEELDVQISPLDIHMILYTSGTTGRPKGAVRGYMENYHIGVTVCIEWRVRSGDVQLAVAPLYHAGPCAWYCATLVSGGTLVVMPAFVPEKVLQNIERHRVNWMMMVPVMYNALLNLPEDVLNKYDITSLKMVISGGAPLHTPTKLKIKQYFKNSELNEFYGSTELGVSTTLRDEDQLRKERCVGKPLQDVELRLLDQDGKEVKKGEVGLLYSRGLGGFRGYWNNSTATEEAFIDGEWATVGDMARQDEDGYYYIVDRAKDMIITGGVNVYPLEIEEVLLKMDEIQDAAVIGVPDEKWGEAVKAIVVPKPGVKITQEDIIEFCKDNLAGFKIPKSIDFAETIPRTQTGKILKKELRKAYWGDNYIQVS